MPELAVKEYCTGCTACASVCPKSCIAMTADEDGFRYPVIDTEKCVECGLCKKTCPVIAPQKKEEEPQAYAAYSRDETMRLESSSGGVFSELARIVLQDGGAVFGAAYNEQFEVVHICVEEEEKLARLRGAKYAQSDLRDVFPEIKQRLDRGQKVLFSGTPCQVGGLKSYLRKDYEKLLTVDFVCHGAPSPSAWQQYVKHQAQVDGKLGTTASINMRAKISGWSRYSYSHRFEYSDGTVTTVKNKDSIFMKLFVGDYLSRLSCEKCCFKGYRRVSDITLGDFWGIWNIAPDMDDNRGTSVILCHSEHGAALLKRISDRLVLRQVTLEECSRENPSMLRSSAANPKRTEALVKIHTGSFEACTPFFLPIKKKPGARLCRLISRTFTRWGFR